MSVPQKAERLFIEKARQLTEQLIPATSASLINATILGFVLWGVIETERIMLWFLFVLAIFIIHFLLHYAYQKRSSNLEKITRQKNVIILSLAATGIIWGASGVFLFPTDSIGHQSFIAFILGGMVAGSVGSFSVFKSAFLAFSIPALVPIMVMFIKFNDGMHSSMGAMIGLFWLIMFITAGRMNRAITASLSLKLENLDLISDLEKEINERKNVEQKLLRKNRQIEGIVEERTAELQKSYSKLIIEIKERKRAEEERIKAQKILGEHEKLALIGQVAGKMAHDFNNVLGIIMGNAELSIFDCKEVETKKTLELIYEQTKRGKNLTKNLIAFAKSQEPKQEFLKIDKKIDMVTDLLKKDLEGIKVIKESSPGIPDLLADSEMIEHALVNLIQNSIHATSLVEYPTIILRTYCSEDNIYFEIEDNGCGISEEHFKNIYEPAFTLKGSRDLTGDYKSGIKGTGYGMSNIKKYIELHQGTISFESKPNSGTNFKISFPVINKELVPDEKMRISKEMTHFEKSILLVEDESAISDIQSKVLTVDPCSHHVDLANTAQAAMDLFDKNKYDLISLDYVLPGKISGMDVYNHIRKTNQTIPILFISGNIEFLESVKDLMQKDKYINHQSKPCRNKDYVKSINKLLEKRFGTFEGSNIS